MPEQIEQYVQELLELDDFVWNQGIELPVGLTREYMEGPQFLKPRENLIFLGSVGTGTASWKNRNGWS